MAHFPRTPASLALIIGGAAAVATFTAIALASKKTVIPGCLEQAPQPFLIRSNYLKDRSLLPQAMNYRTQNYGYFPGFGDPSLNAHPPSFYARPTTFFGIPVTLNEKIIPILKCVETAIKLECSSTPYQPQALSGLRLHNSYHDSFEISNHCYGIALDIDPMLNPCCHCTPGPAGPQNPICSHPDTGPYSRMAMPSCWISVFERFGFYWLGHDVLADKMHLEFLGDPNV